MQGIHHTGNALSITYKKRPIKVRCKPQPKDGAKICITGGGHDAFIQTSGGLGHLCQQQTPPNNIHPRLRG